MVFRANVRNKNNTRQNGSGLYIFPFILLIDFLRKNFALKCCGLNMVTPEGIRDKNKTEYLLTLISLAKVGKQPCIF
jgi:hypothetical protein